MKAPRKPKISSRWRRDFLKAGGVSVAANLAYAALPPGNLKFPQPRHASMLPTSHDAIGLPGFGQIGVVPEAVIETLEDDQAGIDSSAQEGAVQYGGVAQQHV